MAGTSELVAYLAEDRTTAERVAAALQDEGLASRLVELPPDGRLGAGRVEVRVSAESSARARVLALRALGR